MAIQAITKKAPQVTNADTRAIRSSEHWRGRDAVGALKIRRTEQRGCHVLYRSRLVPANRAVLDIDLTVLQAGTSLVCIQYGNVHDNIVCCKVLKVLGPLLCSCTDLSTAAERPYAFEATPRERGKALACCAP